MADQVVRVTGLAELRRAMLVANRTMTKDLRTAIEAAGEPVRQAAEQNALANISGMRRGTIPWHRMRSGVYRGTIGFVAPVQRGDKSLLGRRRRGTKFKQMMLDRAMQPALEGNEDRIMDEFNEAVRDMARAWERV